MSIFLSHSQLDSDPADVLAADIAASGRAIWLDKIDLVGGSQWWPEILKQIRACDVFVFAVSPLSLHSVACNEEFDYARALGRPILPVVISDIGESDRFEHDIFQVQEVDYRHPEDKPTWFALTKALSAREREASALPEPLPPEPTTPYGYLLALARTIRGRDDISRLEQESIFRQLSEALPGESDPRVLTTINTLLRSLRARPEVTVRVANEIDSLLGSEVGSGGDRPQDGVLPATTAPPEDVVLPQDSVPSEGAVERKKGGSQGFQSGPARAKPEQPGWYVDPEDQRFVRYWDGTDWTDRRPYVTNERPVYSVLAFGFGALAIVPWIWGFGLVALFFAFIALGRRQKWWIIALVTSVVGPTIGAILFYSLHL
jgi:hypothetical protein